jgi:hypothetical protein
MEMELGLLVECPECKRPNNLKKGDMCMGVKIRERPAGSGIWWIFIDHQGTRKAKKVGKDKKLAMEAAKKIEAKLALGDMGIMEEQLKSPIFRRICRNLAAWVCERDAPALHLCALPGYFNSLRLPGLGE